VNYQTYLDHCKDEIDEFTKLPRRRAMEALEELEEYARERRLDIDQQLQVERLRRAEQRRKMQARKVRKVVRR
jgi:hypothetical protein